MEDFGKLGILESEWKLQEKQLDMRQSWRLQVLGKSSKGHRILGTEITQLLGLTLYIKLWR